VVGDRLEQEYPDTLRRLAAQVTPRAKLWLIVAGEQERVAVERLLMPLRRNDQPLRFLQAPTDTIWMRDFGPVFISDAKGRRSVVDLEYSLPQRDDDNAVTASVARQTGTPLVRLPFLLEGGNLLSNGQGLCVVTTLALNRNISRGYEPAEVVEGLGKSFGVEQLVVLEPLWGESTGHVDMFACFTAPDTILVGSGAPASDPADAAILDRNAALLAKVRLDTGPLRVVRVPMPGHDDGVWRTYTNGIFVNRLYLMPTYAGSDPSGQAAAFKTFQRLLPGWTVVGLDVGPLIKEGGALRCISLQVPCQKSP
jgi:agmatine deiminase